MQKVILLAALATIAIARPNNLNSVRTTTPTCASSSKNANFDDLTAVAGVALTPIPTPYMGLNFQGFGFIKVVPTNLAPGIFPHSGNNYAFSSVLSTTTGGSAEWTTNYPSSLVKSFTPSSFYYGCTLNAGNGAADPPIACNIAITGFKSGDDTAEAVQVAAQGFSYNPTTNTGTQQMALGTFGSAFKDLQYVLIQYSLPGGLAGANPDLVLVVDDVKYTVCT